MSTLILAHAGAAATAPATAGLPQPTLAQLLAVLGFTGALALAVTAAAWFLGAFRGRGVAGPARIPAERPVWPTAVALGVAILLFLVSLTALIITLGLVPGAAAEAATPDMVTDAAEGGEESSPDPQKMVSAMRVQVIAYGMAVVGALLVHGLARRAGIGATLGLGVTRLPRGIGFGLLALLVVLPWMMFAAAGLQVVRVLMGYPPGAMHQVLQAIRDNPTAEMIGWGLVSALVIAPIAEEVLFRGLLQTVLVHGLPRLFNPAPAPVAAGFPIEPAAAPRDTTPPAGFEAVDDPNRPFAPPPAVPAPYSPAPVEAVEAADPASLRPVWRWTGIAISGFIFACLHEPWSIPLIFLLALAFGYIYERTGNLWAAIVVHFGFNAMNVLFVLPQVM